MPMPGSCRESQERCSFLLMSQVRFSTKHSLKRTQHHSPQNLPNAQFPLQPEEPKLCTLVNALSRGLWSTMRELSLSLSC